MTLASCAGPGGRRDFSSWGAAVVRRKGFPMSPCFIARRWSRVAVVAGFTAFLAGVWASPAAAETAKERRQRVEQERKQRDQAKADRRRKDAEQKAMEKARQQQTAAKVIKLEEHGFQFSTVSGWMVGEVGGVPGIVSGVVYIDPKADLSRPIDHSMMVRVLPIEEGKSLDDVMAAGTKELNCHGPHYKVEPGEDLDVGGEAGRTLVFDPQEDSVKGKKSFIAAARHGDNAYVFWVMTTPDDYEKIRPQAEKMIRSTKWLDGKPTARDAEAKAPKTAAKGKGGGKKTSPPKKTEKKDAEAGKDAPAAPAPEGDGF